MLVMNDFLNEIKISSFTKELTSISEDEHLFDKRKKSIQDYVDYIYEIVKKSSFEKTAVIIDFFSNRLPLITYYLLEKKDDKIFRAALVLEKCNHIEPSSIRDNLEEVKKKSELIMTSISEDKSDIHLEINRKKYDLLNEYLKGQNYIDDTTYDDLRNFAYSLDNIDMVLFRDTNKKIIPSRDDIINVIFSSDVDIEILSRVFHNVLLKNPYLKAFDYEEIMNNDELYITKISGLYRKIPKEFFDCFQIENITQEDLRDLNVMLSNIGRINEDDEQGLLWFFGQISSNITDKLDNYFKENNKYYKKYSNNITASFDNSVDKLLRGEIDIDSSIIESLGTCKKFKNNFNLLLNKFINSEDKEYQKIMLIPLTRALVELQKEKYELSFKVITTTNILDNNTFGYFDPEDDILYINPFMFDAIKDKKNAFVYACRTIFHEARHALQHKQMQNDSSYNFDNLIKAMDFLLSKDKISDYYKKNYDELSYEKDARNDSTIKTMEFFKEYNNMHQYLKNINNEEPSFLDIIRKDITNNNQCILKLFIDDVNNSLECCENKEELDYVIKELNNYKVLWQFFDLDLDNRCIKLKSMEYFNEKIDDLNTKKFLYLMKVNSYMEENDTLIDNMTGEELEKVTLENVGSMPKIKK